MSQSSGASGGIGIGGLLLVLFIVLKLTSIGWFASASWWWAPVFLFGPALAVLGVFLGVAAFGVGAVGLFSLLDKIGSGRRVKLR